MMTILVAAVAILHIICVLKVEFRTDSRELRTTSRVKWSSGQTVESSGQLAE